MNEIVIEDWTELESKFYRDTMSATRKKISEHIRETDKIFKRDCRIEHLTDKLHSTIEAAFSALCRYFEARENGHTMARVFCAERYTELKNDIRTIQGKIISLKHPNQNRQGITRDQIDRAKEYPFPSLLEFRRGKAACPFHQDKTPSLHLYQNNRVHCFSCGGTWDTIGFLQSRDNLSFKEAVTQLNH